MNNASFFALMEHPEMERQLVENTRLTQEIHKVLIGQPQYKQPGLVDDFYETKKMVKKHDYLLVRWGGAIAAVLIILEALHLVS